MDAVDGAGPGVCLECARRLALLEAMGAGLAGHAVTAASASAVMVAGALVLVREMVAAWLLVASLLPAGAAILLGAAALAYRRGTGAGDVAPRALGAIGCGVLIVSFTVVVVYVSAFVMFAP